MNKKMAARKEARTGIWASRICHGGLGRAVFIGLSMAVLCLSSCKTKPDPGAPDPRQPQNNPLIGVWQDGNAGNYYFFREDGTGGIAAAPGAAPDDYSFLFWRGQGLGVAASGGINHLVTISGDTSGAASATIKRYTVEETGGDSITISPQGEAPVTLSRRSGSGVPLSLNNSFIGEWHALWNGTHGDENAWSFKFREDGTVLTYHHGMHQFDNAYLVRGSVMALLGEWRFDGNFDLKYMTFTVQNPDSITAQEEPADGAPGLSWAFNRISAAEWK
ncbi:MAG: hypothetical protein LBP81_04105 [Treponema sp.]|nr:hypothetical protein [Treponema sp.]